MNYIYNIIGTSMIFVIFFFHSNTYLRNQYPFWGGFFAHSCIWVLSPANIACYLNFGFLLYRQRGETGDRSSLFTVGFWEMGEKKKGSLLIWLYSYMMLIWGKCHSVSYLYWTWGGRSHACIWLLWTLQWGYVYWGISFSIKRDGFTYISYKYLYRERSRTLVSWLLHKNIFEVKAWRILTHQKGRPTVLTKTWLVVQNRPSSQAGCETLTEWTNSCVNACLESSSGRELHSHCDGSTGGVWLQHAVSFSLVIVHSFIHIILSFSSRAELLWSVLLQPS